MQHLIAKSMEQPWAARDKFDLCASGRKLLYLYFLFSISYAHLPLALVHHSLGSLFNYLAPPMLLLFAMMGIGGMSLSCAERRYNGGMLGIISGMVVLQFPAIFISVGADAAIRALGSAISTLLSLCYVGVLVCLARNCGFCFRELRSAVQAALIILLVYLVIETIGLRYQLEPFSLVVDLVSHFLNYRDEAWLSGGRVRGFSNEPSYLAVVIIYLSAILLIDNTRSRRQNYALLGCLVVVSAASVSKNVLVGIVFLLVVHAMFYRHLIPVIASAVACIVLYFVYSTSQIDGIQWQYDEYGVDFSTITRVGSWVAAMTGFLDAPLLGNGFGLAGGLITKFYPAWFYVSPEALDWESASVNYGSPVFSYLFRILFEMGLAGAVFFLMMIYLLIRCSNRRSVFSHDNFLLFSGFLLTCAMVDAMSFWPFYAALGIARGNEDVC